MCSIRHVVCIRTRDPIIKLRDVTSVLCSASIYTRGALASPSEIDWQHSHVRWDRNAHAARARERYARTEVNEIDFRYRGCRFGCPRGMAQKK